MMQEVDEVKIMKVKLSINKCADNKGTSNQFRASWCSDSVWSVEAKEATGTTSSFLKLHRECCNQSDVLVRAEFVMESSGDAWKINKIFHGTSTHKADSVIEGDRWTSTFDIMCKIEIQQLDGINSDYSLPKDLGKLLKCQKYSDVLILARGKEFRVHKAVLSVRSDVFAAMFDNEMKENSENVVEITDIEPEVMEQMIEFIYTEDCPKMTEMAEELLIAAEKYQIKQLKDICMQKLREGLTISNVSERLIFAEVHSASKLKECALMDISKQPLKVSKTEGWAFMKKHHPSLISEAFDVLAARCEEEKEDEA